MMKIMFEEDALGYLQRRAEEARAWLAKDDEELMAAHAQKLAAKDKGYEGDDEQSAGDDDPADSPPPTLHADKASEDTTLFAAGAATNVTSAGADREKDTADANKPFDNDNLADKQAAPINTKGSGKRPATMALSSSEDGKLLRVSQRARK